MVHPHRLVLAVLLAPAVVAEHSQAADRFYISIPGPTLSYVPLYYDLEKGFFA